MSSPANDAGVADSLGGHELSLAVMLFSQPPPNDYIFLNMSLVAGTGGLVFAPGDTGKSWLLLEMCVAVALAGTDEAGMHASDPLGFRPKPPPRGHLREGKGWPVVYLTAEDPDDQLHYRLYHCADALTNDQRTLLTQNLRIRSWQGDMLLDVMSVGADRDLIAYCKDARFVGVDTLTRFHRADEKDNGEMGQVINVFERMGHAGPAVVIAHHISKAAISEGATRSMEAARGGISIGSNLRWGFSLARCPDDDSLLVGDEGKHSYGTRHGGLYFRRNQYGVLSSTTAPEAAEDGTNITRIGARKRGKKPTHGGVHGIY